MSNNTGDLKSIPLEQNHIRLGAKMAPFGGWNMPLYYTQGILHEHQHTRREVSLFDCSHMGQFRVRGSDAADDLDRCLPRRVSSQKNGSCRYNLLLTDEGTVGDDLIVYRISENEFYIVVNAGTISADGERIREFMSSSTEFSDESDDTVKLDVQGPKTADVLAAVGLPRTVLPRYYRFINYPITDVPCLISRTGYTGELGVEIYCHKRYAEKLWSCLIDQDGIAPAGLGARDTLRLEMGYPLYGHELSREITPVEAGFGELLDLDRDFVGRSAQLNPPKRKLVAIKFNSRRAVRHGSRLYDHDDNSIGVVTSGSYSPSLACSIALGYLGIEYAVPEFQVIGKSGTAEVSGIVTSTPFYPNGTVRNPVNPEKTI